MKNAHQLSLFNDNIDEEQIKSKIRQRRKQILIHSCIYYRLDDNIISDYKYDMWGKELGKLQREYPELSKQVPDYYEWFKDYTPECTSGYNLPIYLPEVIATAEYILRLHEKYGGKKN